MFITREAYLVATIGNIPKVRHFLWASESSTTVLTSVLSQQNKPELWYPLVATTELIGVLLFMVPGLVPSQEEVVDSREEQTRWSRNPIVRLTQI